MLVAGDVVYLASPYSHPSFHVREGRYGAVRDVAIKLMHAGVHTFSPILYGHNCLPELSHWKNPEWLAFDFAMLGRCDKLAVLTISGWDISEGVRAEMEHAVKLCKTIFMVDPATVPDALGKEVPVQRWVAAL